MKNSLLIFVVAMLGATFITSCGGGECVTCTANDPFLGLSIEQEICDNEDGTVTVTSSALGISQDTTFNGTLSGIEEEFLNSGFENAACN